MHISIFTLGSLTASIAMLAVSAQASNNAQYVTSCSGVDSRGNEITIKVLDLGIDNPVSVNEAALVIELQSPNGNFRYNVLPDDIDSADVYLNATSRDNGGIEVDTDGDGHVASGKIGVLKSTFSLDCTPGPAAP
jgi:hypothetical protein